MRLIKVAILNNEIIGTCDGDNNWKPRIYKAELDLANATIIEIEDDAPDMMDGQSWSQAYRDDELVVEDDSISYSYSDQDGGEEEPHELFNIKDLKYYLTPDVI